MSSLLNVSQKCQYALRALFELSLRYPSDTVTTVSEISDAQDIPLRFLEQIFSKLRTGGYVESRRGNQGGYIMAIAPSKISVGEIIRFVEGSEEPVESIRDKGNPSKGSGDYVFKELWDRAKASISEIFDTATFQDLVDKKRKNDKQIDYSI